MNVKLKSFKFNLHFNVIFGENGVGKQLKMIILK